MATFPGVNEQIREAKLVERGAATTESAGARGAEKPPLPMRVILVRLVLGVLAPLLLLVTIYGAWNVQLHRNIAMRGLREAVRVLSFAVDRQMQAAQVALSTLALSPSLQNDDFATFQKRASAAGEQFGGWIVVGDETLHPLVNTLLPLGSPLPPLGEPELTQRTFATGQSSFSGLFTVNHDSPPAVAVSVPVIRDGRVVYDLRMNFPPKRLEALLDAQEKPEGWTFVLIDANRREIAQTGGADDKMSMAIDGWLEARSQDPDQGLIEGADGSGQQLVLAYHRSAVTGWLTAAAVPLNVLNNPVNQATLILAAGGVFSLFLAILAALTIGRRIAGPLQALAGEAEAIVRGELPPRKRQPVLEIANVRRALLEAGDVYRRQMETHHSLERERRAREQAERSRADMEMRERKSRRLIESNLIGIVIAEERRIVEANGVFLGMLGYDLAELQAGGIPLRRIAPPDDPLLNEAAMLRLQEAGEIAPFERDLLRKDGSRVPVLVGAARIVTDAPGLSWVCFVIDLTLQKRAAINLKRSEERYRGLAQAIASVVWTADAGGAMVHMHHWSELTGQTAEQYAGKGWSNVLHPDDRGPTLGKWTHAITNRLPIEIEYRMRNRNGRYRWYHARGVPILNPDNSIREWIGVCFDIDDRKAAAVRQLLLMSELDHRVRNILATIHSMISLTGSGAESKEEYAALLQGRIGAMARMHGLLSRQTWSGATLMQIVSDELAPFTAASSAIDIDGDAEFTLRPKDALDFALVIHELMTNAVQHGVLSEPGGRLSISWHVDPQSGRLTFTWVETGGPPLLRRVTHRGFGSRLMNNVFNAGIGRSAFCSYLPTGFSCTLTMPTQQPAMDRRERAAAASAEPAGPIDAIPEGRILIVEDEPLIAMELHRLLSQAGLEVSGPVASLKQALDLAEDQTLTGAVIDINLGFDTSYPVADRLRASGLPVIFVTGYAAEMLPERFATQPILRKPIDPHALITTLRRELGQANAASSSPQTSDAALAAGGARRNGSA